ncbi:hypothetical protein Dtox_0881 [Desulfofarcimen acetoxidans DSM 771]|uniref:Uncharacterized protein n=1 Tax=Desulfofarcimen acetoxidans (strain ATCC 49208 / DSM 771 / KCTC 5769 / VKM B-1644 / 5575) TaxID=485916 RepID=C8W2B4_DESAS|nr:hypothetical protein [Desulfofarcimen acetoxidans]ACV61778.1 hypothetical protein Dtox_0881 [Desulfofarcimen acetoxidans DSM 771]
MKFKRRNLWNIQIVDEEGKVGYEPPMTLDQNDVPHVCYLESKKTIINMLLGRVMFGILKC